MEQPLLSSNDTINTIWKYKSNSDIFRRYIISAAKAVSITSLIIFFLESQSLVATEAIWATYRPYAVGFTFLFGGLVEPLLSSRPNLNVIFLPIWNCLIFALQDILLKLASSMIIFCGLEKVPDVPGRYLPERTCVEQRNVYIKILAPIFAISCLYSGYREYMNYKDLANMMTTSNRQVSRLSRTILGTLKYCLSCFRINEDDLQNLSVSGSSFLSMISFIATLSTIFNIKDPDNETPRAATIIYQTAPAFLLSFLSYVLQKSASDDIKAQSSVTDDQQQYSNSLALKVQRHLFTFNRFTKPTLANLYACSFFTFSVLPAIFNFENHYTTALDIITSAFAYISILILNYLYSLEAKWFKYDAPAIIESNINLDMSSSRK